jgi:hypothetical protein
MPNASERSRLGRRNQDDFYWREFPSGAKMPSARRLFLCLKSISDVNQRNLTVQPYTTSFSHSPQISRFCIQSPFLFIAAKLLHGMICYAGIGRIIPQYSCRREEKISTLKIFPKIRCCFFTNSEKNTIIDASGSNLNTERNAADKYLGPLHRQFYCF